MTETRQRISKRKSFCGLSHVAIPAIVYITELAIWAGLNLNGLGDHSWTPWRVSALIALVILFCTAVVFDGLDKSDSWLAAAGAIFPWFILFVGIIVYGFIQMTLSFVTVSLFFWGVLASGVCQVLFIIFIKCLNEQSS